MNQLELKEFLDEQADRFNRPAFLELDPLSIPHRYTKREDREISGFLAATLAWGQRTTILRNMLLLMQRMDESPYTFVADASEKELNALLPFVHRTFNGTDLLFFLRALRRLYREGGLERFFVPAPGEGNLWRGIVNFRHAFLAEPHEPRSEKHLANPGAGSAAKRIHMFLRWMVRKDDRGVDLGLWTQIPAALLSCPLDVHSGRVARQLGLLNRKQNDATAVLELDGNLRALDPLDPVRYDFALFGISALKDLS